MNIFPRLRSLSIAVAVAAISPLAVAFPYDDSLDNLIPYQTIEGVESRTSGTVRTYNIADTSWPDELRISILGGDGGRAHGTTVFEDQAADGGGGALVSGKFKIHPSDANALRPGGEIRFIVGSKGTDRTQSQAAVGGGGGGTAVLYRAPTEGAQWEILAVAGGGGGGAADTDVTSTYAREGGNGTTTTAGGDGRGHDNGGVKGGAGGREIKGTEYGGGGGGLSNGRDNPVDGGGGNSSGGVGGDTQSGAGDGGFGFGGGGASGRYAFNFSYGIVAGGGGGYSGGGAGESGGGGGGGSYLDSRALNPSITSRESEGESGSVDYWAIPNANNTSLSAPAVVMIGSSPLTYYTYQVVADPGADAIDVFGNGLTTSSSGFPAAGSPAGTYYCDYTATDQFGVSTTVTRTIVIKLANKPVFDIPESASGNEDSGGNTQVNFATNIHSMDADQSVLYFLVSNDNNALFEVQPAISADGTLTFTPATDAVGSAEVTAIAVDSPDDASQGFSDPQTFILTINNTPDPPTDLSLSSNVVNEGSVNVGTVTASDPFGGTVTYALTGGADIADFSLDANTGELTFREVPDFESPHDANLDNIYQIEVTASGSDGSAMQAFSITVSNLSEWPVNFVISHDEVTENTTEVGVCSAVDEFGGTVSFGIASGWDSALFTINAVTGELSFINAPNFENPMDQGNDNLYRVMVKAYGSKGNIELPFDVQVFNTNDAPDATVLDQASVNENTTVIGTLSSIDQDGDSVTYELVGGDDSSRFTLDSNTGALSFSSKRNFESPADQDKNNVYEFIVRATDSESATVDTPLTVTVLDVNEAPTPRAIETYPGRENQTEISTIEVNDPEGDPLTYTITGGTDAACFTLDEITGDLAFVNPPDFENPQDANANNLYLLNVAVSDGEFTKPFQVVVEVRDYPEAPTAILLNGQDVDTLNVDEDVAAGTVVATLAAVDPDAGSAFTYELTNDAGGLFELDGVELKLAAGAALDYEASPTHTIEIKVTDETRQIFSKSITVLVGDVNEFQIDAFRSLYGLAEDGSDDNADWSNNGIANIFYLAFGLGDPNESNIDRTRLPKGAKDESSFIFSYLEPAAADSGLTLVPKISTDLNQWQTPAERGELPTAATEDLGDGYQRVTLTFPVQSSPRYFVLAVE